MPDLRNRAENGEVRLATTRALTLAAIPYVLIGAFLIAAVVLAGEDIRQHFGAIEAWIARLGPWSALAFIPLFVLLTTMLVPGSVLSLAAGALFGLPQGVLVIVTGNLLAAALQWLLAHHMLRDLINRMLTTRPSLAVIQRKVLLNEVRLQLLLRLTPVNPATISYVLGAAGVRFRGFMLACVALTPHLAIEVWFGAAGKHVVQAVGGSTQPAQFHDFAIIGGLVLAIVALIVIASAARKAFTAAAARAGSGEDTTIQP